MVIVRATWKLLPRLSAPAAPDDVSTTMLGDWCGTFLNWRPRQIALFVSETTLLPVLFPLAPASSVFHYVRVVKSPRDYAVERERRPQLPPGTEERVSGYGVMGQPFASGHVLGLRRWTASSVGDQFTSIWHRDPAGEWHFYESAQPMFACSRWFGHGVRESTVVDIDLTWEAPDVLHVMSPGLVDWTVTLGSSPMTHVMNGVGSALPYRAWRSASMLKAMGAVATATLGAGRVGMTGLTANGKPFDANPLRIWRVTDSTAWIAGRDAGRPAPLTEQARLGDFWIPQRGIFAMGRVFVTG